MDFINKDTVYLQTAIPDLKEYLLSKEIYWPITARGHDLPRLTLGGLLLSQARLAGSNQLIETYNIQLDAIRSSWRVAWETKAGREYNARVNLWKNFMMDYKNAPEQHVDAYPHEVRLRVMLQLLGDELPAKPPEQATLSQLDGVLHAALIRSEFIWEAGLQEAFPAEVYWYLYGKLRN